MEVVVRWINPSGTMEVTLVMEKNLQLWFKQVDGGSGVVMLTPISNVDADLALQSRCNS